MDQALKINVGQLNKDHEKKRRWQKVVMLLAAIVVFCTTYALILPAITMEFTCQKQEHTHTDDCYTERVLYYATALRCSLDKHAHTDKCYDGSGNLVCSKEEHTHADGCYGESKPVTEKVLVCKLEEHTHNELCYDSIFRPKMKMMAAPTSGGVNTVTWEMKPNANGSYTLYVGGSGAIPANFCLDEDLKAALNEITADGNFVDVVIGKDITSVGQDAFYNLSMLKSVAFEDYSACKTIELNAFRACANVTTVTFPEHNSLETIGNYAFYRMQTLKEVNLEVLTKLTTIGDCGFAEYNDLVSVKLPPSLKRLGTSAFASCAELQHCDLTECKQLTAIPQTCFLGDSKLLEITIPSGCSSIGTQAFQNCYALETVDFQTGNVSDTFVFNERCFAMSGQSQNHTAMKSFNMEALSSCGKVAIQHGGNTFSMFMYGGPESITIPSNFVGGLSGTYKDSLYCMFHYATNVQHIHFLDNDNPLKIGNTFAAHTGIYEFDLRPLKNVSGTVHLPYGGTGSLDPEPNLETIYLPDGATTVSSGESCPALRNIVFTDGSVVSKISGFYKCDSLAEIDLSELGKLKTITAAFHDDETLSVIKLPQNGQNILLDDSFYNDPALVEVDLTDSSVYQLSRVFYNDPNLKRVALPSSFYIPDGTAVDSTQPDGHVHKGIFYNDPALEDVYINSVKIAHANNTDGTPTTYWFSDDSFTNCGPFTLHFGPDVDELPIEFLQDASRSCGDILFAGPNNITFYKKEENEHKGANLPSMLKDLEGEYYADASGALYKLNGDGTATLVYVPPYVHQDKWDEEALESYTIPEKFTDAKGNEYTVTAVRPDAFLEAYNLTSLNGIDEIGAANEDLIAKGFENVELNYTLLENSQNLHPDYPGRKAPYPEDEGTVVHNPITIKEKDEEGNDKKATTSLTISTAYDDLYTNESSKNPNDPSNIIVSVGNTSGAESKIARVYFAFSNPDYYFTATPLDVEQSSTTGSNSFNYMIHRVGDSDIYYIDIGPIADGTTGSLDFQPLYSSPDTPGGKLKIWGELIDSPTAPANPVPADGALCHEIVWNTVPDHFDLDKAEGTGQKIIKNGSDYFITGLNYTLKLIRDGEALNAGKNLISDVDFSDYLTLPEEIVYRPGLLEAIEAGNWRIFASGSTNKSLYVTIGEQEYLVATVTVTGLKNLDARVEDGKLVLYWTAKNSSTTTEYSMGTGKVVYGNEVLTLSPDTELRENMNLSITNTADALIRYNYNGETYDPDPDSATVVVKTGEPNVSVAKTQSRKSGYWGEDQTFTITVSNNTLFSFDGAVNVHDQLTEIYYIKPADLVRMFAEDEFKDLEIRITNATLCDADDYLRREITLIDGTTKSMTSIVNSSGCADFDNINAYYAGKNSTVADIGATQQNVIVIGWNEAGTGLVLKVYKNDKATAPEQIIDLDNVEDIGAALESINYMPTISCRYYCVWRMDPDRVVVGPQEERVYKIYSTFKDTFAFLDGDENNQHKTSSKGSNVANSGTLTYPDGSTLSSKITTNSFTRDFKLTKDITQNGKTIGDGNQLKDEAPLDNIVTIQHNGTGVYDLLPIVDRMTGAQMLIAKVSDNQNASWAAGLETVTVRGEEYYLLTAPDDGTVRTYEGVWVGGYYADRVEVAESASGYDTLIHWYMQDCFGNTTTLRINYPSYVSCDRTGTKSTTFNANNQVWLNDHPTHRLYASFGVGGTNVNFSKYIVEKQSGETTYEKNSVIARGMTVTYRLRLEIKGGGTFNGSELYDMLPQNYGDFTWAKGYNVEIADYIYDPEIAMLTGTDLWSIGDKPTGQPDFVPEEGQQYINWDPGFTITYKESGTLDIIVKLTFPSDGKWDDYCISVGGGQVNNTFWFQKLPDSVTHDLIAPVSARLQKGVFDTGFLTNFTTASTGSYPYVPRKNTRFYTNSTNGNDARVTYYVNLYNDGPGRLYLETIEDILPKGFTFFSLTNALQTPNKSYNSFYPYFQLTVGSKIGYTSALTERTKFTSTNGTVSGYYHTFTETNYTADPLSTVTRTDGSSVTYVVANLTVDTSNVTEDGRQLLLITVDGNDSACTLSYDEEAGKWYLKAGECLRFGYDVNTNNYSKTTDSQLNAVVMETYDPYDAGMSVCKSVAVAANNSLAPNNGDCAMISSAQAHANGFVGGNGSSKWLSSDVTVNRVAPEPGISKRDTRVINAEGAERMSNGNIGYDDTVVWETIAENAGASALVDYTITDKMPAPFRFTGPVYYEIYEHTGLLTSGYAAGCDGGKQFSPILSSGINHVNGEKHSDCSSLFPLFTLTRGDNGECYIVTSSGTQRLTSGVPVAIGGSTSPVPSFQYYQHYVTGSGIGSIGSYKPTTSSKVCEVTWTVDKDGNETLSVHFTSNLLAIPADGEIWLQYRTQECTDSHENKTYLNRTWITPTQEFDPDLISNGNYSEELGAPSVYADEPITLSSGFTTTATKTVTELDENGNKTGNEASTDMDSKWILLSSAESMFRYTMTVNVPSGHGVTQKLVMIDNLPEVNDHNTFSNAVPRSSAFGVSFADQPDVHVYVNGTETTDYTVSFTTKTEFTVDDWAGNAAAYWKSFAETEGARSIRVCLANVPDGANVRVEFTTKVTDPEKAVPGTVAWNNFGYSYTISEATLQAAPSNIGIRVPSVPKLQKKLVLGSAAYPAPENTNFTFLIYKGARMEALEGASRTEIETLLNGIEHHYVTIPVPKGKTESAAQRLISDDLGANLNTFWVDGTTYSILELDPGDDYRFSTLNVLSEKTYTFTYHNDTNITLTAVNARHVWDVLLSKTDKKETDILLPGAVFGIYSPNPDDLLPEDKRQGADAQIVIDGMTYYLMAVSKTNAYGTIEWSGLLESVYAIVEITPPAGYYLDNEPHLVYRDQAVDDLFELALTNECGYELPATGGKGTTLLYVIGFVLLISVLLTAFGYMTVRRRRSARHQ